MNCVTAGIRRQGSAKSFSFAKMAAIWGFVEPLRILCTRDIQDSIKESFHAELKNAMHQSLGWKRLMMLALTTYAEKNGTEFILGIAAQHHIDKVDGPD